jgi:hypothetical protein
LFYSRPQGRKTGDFRKIRRSNFNFGSKQDIFVVGDEVGNTILAIFEFACKPLIRGFPLIDGGKSVFSEDCFFFLLFF